LDENFRKASAGGALHIPVQSAAKKACLALTSPEKESGKCREKQAGASVVNGGQNEGIHLEGFEPSTFGSVDLKIVYSDVRHCPKYAENMVLHHSDCSLLFAIVRPIGYKMSVASSVPFVHALWDKNSNRRRRLIKGRLRSNHCGTQHEGYGLLTCARFRYRSQAGFVVFISRMPTRDSGR
jgi:hypothetical protein